MIEVDCNYCGSTVERYESRLKENKNAYCDRECLSSFQSENVSGENHHQYNSITVECDFCGQETEKTQGRVERSKNDFCSPNCYTDFKKENAVSGKEHHQYSRVKVDCDNCGTTIERVPSRTDTEQKFCDTSCMAEWYQDNSPAGKDHWNWDGGEVVYGKGWNEEKRESVRKRDNRTCQDCGMGSEKHHEEYNRRLCVHHIIPARDFDNALERNAMDNLVSLCCVCHQKWEQIPYLTPC